ncbi:MAG TPA: DUF4340 domain-containing protein [Bacteroidales bacterium]|nr:DUF4340 domain-containing protein [Bacteroidales bacterium]
MKKNRLPVLLVVILAAITAALLLFKNHKNTLDKQNSSFAIEDTASITKVFLADKENNTVTLTRLSPSQWKVNNEFNAAKDAINMLLKTLMSVEVKEPVSKAGREQIVKLLATTSVKVEIYQKVYRINLFDKIKWFPHEKLTKTYYVGCATQNNMGTYMLIEGTDDPYITHIFGFNGFLTTRYSPLVKDWRDHVVFNLKYPQIKSVSVKILDDPKNSFKAIKKSPKDFELFALADNKPVAGFDTIKMMELFSAFEDVRFEALINDLDRLKKDSVISSKPYIIIDVEGSDGKVYNVTSFLRKAPEDEIDQQGNPVIYDRDRLYALINNKKDLVLIQFYTFGTIFKPLDYYKGVQLQNQ